MNLDAKVNNQIFRRDYPIIIAMNRQLAKIGPVRIAHQSADLQPGQCLARVVSTGLWGKFSAVSGSTIDSHCILLDQVPAEETGTTGQGLARALFGADVYQDNCVELDSTMKTALGGRTIVNNGQNIFSF